MECIPRKGHFQGEQRLGRVSQHDSRELRIGQLLNELLDRCANGDAVSFDSFLADYPDLADELREDLQVLGQIPKSKLGAGLAPGDRNGIPGYEILAEIGRGGMGVVFQARQESTGRLVALKVMLGGALTKPSTRRRFRREVELAAQLRHPNIVTIHESGTSDGQWWFAMDHVSGVPLDVYVHTQGCTVRRLVELFAKICGAVSYAHQRGIIHRDLKPSNILVDASGEPWVLDFGLARPLDAEAGSITTESAPGRLLGTLRYMSPEQSRGAAGALDVRSDVYSLGVMLYELLTGVPPYDTDLQRLELKDAIRNIQECDPPRPSRLRRDCGSEIDAILQWTLEKNPERRYQSAAALQADLEFWLAGRPVIARSHSSLYVLGKLAARHYFHTGVIAALLASIVAFAWISREAMLHERVTAKRLEDLNRRTLKDNAELSRIAEKGLAQQRQAALGWLLLEYQGGRTESARGIQALMSPDSPEYAVAGFLLDDSRPAAEFEAELPAGARALLLFAQGERFLRQGRLREAEAVLTEYLEQASGVWAVLARGRLEQLRKLESTGEARRNTPPPGVPNERP